LLTERADFGPGPGLCHGPTLTRGADTSVRATLACPQSGLHPQTYEGNCEVHTLAGAGAVR